MSMKEFIEENGMLEIAYYAKKHFSKYQSFPNQVEAAAREQAKVSLCYKTALNRFSFFVGSQTVSNHFRSDKNSNKKFTKNRNFVTLKNECHLDTAMMMVMMMALA